MSTRYLTWTVKVLPCAWHDMNRTMQVAPVVDAGSVQSRTDVIGIFMSAVLLLTGLQWLSLKPREMKPVRAKAGAAACVGACEA